MGLGSDTGLNLCNLGVRFILTGQSSHVDPISQPFDVKCDVTATFNRMTGIEWENYFRTALVNSPLR